MSNEEEIVSVEMSEVSMDVEIKVCGESTLFGVRIPVMADYKMDQQYIEVLTRALRRALEKKYLS